MAQTKPVSSRATATWLTAVLAVLSESAVALMQEDWLARRAL